MRRERKKDKKGAEGGKGDRERGGQR